MIRNLIRSAAFINAAKRYAKRHPGSLTLMRSNLELLESDAFAPSLRTHKLKGDLAGSWSCSAGYDLRIVFDFVKIADAEKILLLSVGTHDEVY